MFYSPLRYPGGKNRLSKFISEICVNNNITGHYVEPYAGGASVALTLLIEKKVSQISINDFDRSIYAFWYSILYRTNQFCKMIENVNVNIDEWHFQKAVQKNKKEESLIRLGFSTFFLNRTNMSGIINAGPIGGYKQNGTYKLDCRFKKADLIKRIKLIASHKKNITLFNLDAIELIKEIKKTSDASNTIFYFDPPYYLKGPSLYLNSYNDDGHIKVANEIRKLTKFNWIVSYDNVNEINSIYQWAKKKIAFTLTYNAYKPREGKEVLYFSKNLKISKLTI